MTSSIKTHAFNGQEKFQRRITGKKRYGNSTVDSRLMPKILATQEAEIRRIMG
jgi:hypothetical protein